MSSSSLLLSEEKKSSKETQNAGIKMLMQSSKFKATHMPSFYKEFVPHRAELKKVILGGVEEDNSTVAIIVIEVDLFAGVNFVSPKAWSKFFGKPGRELITGKLALQIVSILSAVNVKLQKDKAAEGCYFLFYNTGTKGKVAESWYFLFYPTGTKLHCWV